MNRKGIVLIISIIAIATLLFIRGGEEPTIAPDSATSVGKTKIAHVFVDGTHIFTGEINLPTPCHTLQHKVAIAELYPEQVTAAFEMKSEVDACVQMVTPEPFVVSFEASEEANFRITLNNKDFPFEIIEVQSVVEKEEKEKATTTIEEIDEEVVVEEKATSTATSTEGEEDASDEISEENEEIVTNTEDEEIL